MRFDAIARFLGDVANDDSDDANFFDPWVLRRCAIEVQQPAEAREELTMTTWCSGTGSRWAERRTSLHGSNGARIETSALWIYVDASTGRPTRCDERFSAVWQEAAQGREVDSRLRLPKKPPEDRSTLNVMPWSFRQSDMDTFGHVNNAAYLAVIEEAFGENSPPSPLRLDVEWQRPSVCGESMLAYEAIGANGIELWITVGDETRATIVGRPL